jgi:glycosyltransferase involved in cell wall biosynthesis
MKILSIEFTDTWSWSLVFKSIQKNSKIDFKRTFHYNKKNTINTKGYDVVLCQNVTLLKKFQDRLKTVCRMGGNQNFDGVKNLKPLLNEMAKCYCLVATNKKLYDIAKSVNDKVYLIPNGIDLKEWSKLKSRNKKSKFTVGFCGNISSPQYRDYKGFDYVKKACKELGVELKTALYKDKQIPHDKMREQFYSQIDCIVHPTKGEGCSNTLMEACACGVPVITTQLAGYHGEVMKDGKDVLFCKRTANNVKKQIEKLINDKELKNKLSNGARKFAEKHHDVNTITKQYDKIFNECRDSLRKNAEVLFASIMKSGANSKAVFSVNGEKFKSCKFNSNMTKEQLIEKIKQDYLKEGI